MQEITLTLVLEEVNAILTVLGDLPTKTNAYPLVIKIKEQAEMQIRQESKDGCATE
jgi:hypothetical protein